MERCKCLSNKIMLKNVGGTCSFFLFYFSIKHFSYTGWRFAELIAIYLEYPRLQRACSRVLYVPNEKDNRHNPRKFNIFLYLKLGVTKLKVIQAEFLDTRAPGL